MTQETILKIEGNIAVLYLNCPENRNAISRALLGSFAVALKKVSDDKNIRSLIVTSSDPRAFCAGADLKERTSMTQEEVFSFLDDLRNVFRILETLSVPTIAVINGDAYGGGLELALCCDIRIISENAKIGLTETKLGIIPGAGGTQRLTRLIGESRAKELIFSARRISSDETVNFGIVNHSYPSSMVLEKSMELAKEFSSSAPIAVQLAKGAISEGFGKEIDEALYIERKYYMKTLDTKDRQEALMAFKEKRAPVFKGE